MDPRRTSTDFKQTNWGLIDGARRDRADLEKLLAQYWSPVYAFLRRRGHDSADAEDLTQGFLQKVVLERDLIAQADPARGRFRSFLITALKRFVVDEYRREHGRDGRRAPAFVPHDHAALAAAEPSDADDPFKAFDRQWAIVVLETALERVATSCRERGMTRQWEAFEARVIGPARGLEPVPVEDLVARLGVEDPQEVYSMIQTVKRKLDRELRDVVAETVASPAEVEHELTELRGMLGGKG